MFVPVRHSQEAPSFVGEKQAEQVAEQEEQDSPVALKPEAECTEPFGVAAELVCLMTSKR